MRLAWWRSLGIAACVTMGLVGCSGAADSGEAAAGQAPTPSPTCSALGGPRECSAEEYARDQEAQQAFREVSARYRAANEDINLLRTSGGEVTETPSLDKYARDQFLEGGKDFGTVYAENNYKLSGPVATRSVTMRSYSENMMTLLACADGREVMILDSETGEELGEGNVSAIQVGAEKRGGEWFLVTAENVGVEECAW